MRAARAAAVLLAALGVIPLANWIGSDVAAPWYSAVASRWLTWGGVTVAAGLALALLSRGAPGLWRAGLGGRLAAAADPASGRSLGLVALGAGLLYLAIAVLVFDARPLHLDEIVQLIQARSYAAGRLAEPADADPAFTSLLHLVTEGGRTFGHFPPGGPAWLALGEMLRAPWLAGPLAGALAVAAFGLVLRPLEPTPAVRGAALLLFALSPFTAFLAGSHMNHAPTLMWALFGVAAVIRLERSGPRSLRLGFAAGLALGMAAATRPPDAIAWVAGAAVWLVAGRRVALAPAVAAMAGLALPLAGALAVNAGTTGSPLRFAYELVWGPDVGLGFHASPWGPPHTPVRGLELVSLYWLRLNVYLFETAIPATLPALLAIVLARRPRPGDSLLLGAAGSLLVVYFLYWHDGFYLGPRFAYGLAPALALWTARLPGALRERGGPWLLAERVAIWTGAVAAALALGNGVPERTGQYATGLASLRWDADRGAEQAGVRDAIVFVQESWGAQLLARLWALGVPKAQAERVYRNVDACRLELALAELEGQAPRPDGTEAVARLAPLQADSGRLLPSTLSPDRTERMLPGATYPRTCVSRFREDQAGMTLLAPHLLSRRPDLLFARNLHERNGALVARHPEKSAYLLTHRPSQPTPVFLPLDRDSILGIRARSSVRGESPLPTSDRPANVVIP